MGLSMPPIRHQNQIICYRCKRIQDHGLWIDFKGWTLFGRNYITRVGGSIADDVIIIPFSVPDNGDAPDGIPDQYIRYVYDGKLYDLGLCPSCVLSESQIRNISNEG